MKRSDARICSLVDLQWYSTAASTYLIKTPHVTHTPTSNYLWVEVWSSQIEGGGISLSIPSQSTHLSHHSALLCCIHVKWHFLFFCLRKETFLLLEEGKGRAEGTWSPIIWGQACTLLQWKLHILSASASHSRRLPLNTSICLSRPRNYVSPQPVTQCAQSSCLMSPFPFLHRRWIENWGSLNPNQAAPGLHHCWAGQEWGVFKWLLLNITRITLQQRTASGRLLLRAAYFWANLPKLNSTLSTLYSSQLCFTSVDRWPILHARAVLHWGERYKQFQGFPPLETQFGKYLAGSQGLRKKEEDLEKWKYI